MYGGIRDVAPVAVYVHLRQELLGSVMRAAR